MQKVGYQSSEDIVGNVVVTGDDVNIEVSVGSNGGADEVGGERDKSNEDINEVSEGEDRNEVSEDEDIEAIVHQLILVLVTTVVLTVIRNLIHLKNFNPFTLANRFCGLRVMSSDIEIPENRFARFSCRFVC